MLLLPLDEMITELKNNYVDENNIYNKLSELAEKDHLKIQQLGNNILEKYIDNLEEALSSEEQQKIREDYVLLDQYL